MDLTLYPHVVPGSVNHIGVALSAYKERLYRSMLEARVARFVDMYFPGGLYEDGPELPGLEVARLRGGPVHGEPISLPSEGGRLDMKTLLLCVVLIGGAVLPRRPCRRLHGPKPVWASRRSASADR